MATHFCPNAATCLAAAVALLASSTIQAGSQPFVIVSQSTIYNWSTSDVDFSATFNEPFVPVPGSPVLMNGPTAFQYFTPDSLIRGGESSTAIVIRSYGPPTDPDFLASNGWGFIIATVPFSVSGDTVTFSAPYGLFSLLRILRIDSKLMSTERTKGLRLARTCPNRRRGQRCC
jgi:hypothetical protein